MATDATSPDLRPNLTPIAAMSAADLEDAPALTPVAQPHATITPSPDAAAPKPAKSILDKALHPFAPRPKETIPVKGPSVTATAAEGRTDLRGLRPVDSKGRPQESGTVTPPETYEISKDVKDGLQAFAASYTQKLIAMEKRNLPTRNENAYEALKREQGALLGKGYIEDNFMLGFFSQVDEITKERTLKSNTEIERLILAHPEMRQGMMMVAERYASDLLAAAGLRARIVGAGRRDRTTNLGRTIDLPINQGSLNKTARSVTQYLTEPSNANGRGEPGQQRWRNIAVGAIAGTSVVATGFMVAGPAGAAVAVGAEAFGAIVARGSRNGVRINLENDHQTSLQASSSRPEEVRRAREILGIDPEDLQYSENLERGIEEALQIIYLRADYLAGFDIPVEKMDALSDQFLFTENQVFEQINEPTRQMIGRRFVDLGGRTIAPGVGRIEMQRDYLRRAQGDTLSDMFGLISKRENAANAPKVKRLELLEAAKKAKGKDGKHSNAQKEAATAEQKKLTEDQKSLTTDDESLTSYTESNKNKVTEADKAKKDLEDLLASIALAGTTATDAKLTAQRLTQFLGTTLVVNIVIPGEYGPVTISTPVIERAKIRAQIQARKDLLPIMGTGKGEDKTYPEAHAKRVKDIEEEFSTALAQVDTQEALIREVIKKLNEGRNRSEAAEIATKIPKVDTVDRTISSYETALADVNAALASLATPATLGTNFEAALTAINTAYNESLAQVRAGNATATVGWPESDNSKAGKRDILRKAFVEQRRQTAIPAGLAGDFNAVIDNPTANQSITANQLRTMDLVRLEALADSLGIVPADAARTTRLTNAKNYAEAQVTELQNSIKTELTSVQSAEEIQTRLIEGVDLGAQEEQIDMVIDILKKLKSVRSKATILFPERGEKSNLTDTNIVTAGTDEYTQAEQDSALPRNVLEVLHILTDYRESDDREKAFQQIWKNISANPNLLFTIFSRSFDNLTFTDINGFGTELANSITNDNMDLSTFGKSVDRTTDELYSWARVI